MAQEWGTVIGYDEAQKIQKDNRHFLETKKKNWR